MHFNPWLYDKEAQLTKVFFEELRRTLAPYSSKLSRSIDNYTDLLLAVDSGWLKLALEVLQQSQSNTTKQFDKLSHEIQKLGRKVVIFIDDVDRLTREELMELFNLVRNSSNLPCLYFVLAYDKSYVLKTLQSDGEHMTRYPEKILQEEYPLPKLTPDKMWAVLKECLNKTQFGKEDEDKKPGEKDKQATNKENKVSTLLRELMEKGVNLPYHLTTIRMVKRMVNAFSSRYELLHSLGINTRDLFIFELIYYVYPSVYDLLLEKHKEALASLNASPGEYSPSSTNSSSSFFFSHTNAEGMRYISLSPELELPSEASRDEDKHEEQAASDQSNQPPSTIGSIVDTLKELTFGLKDGYKKDIVVENIVELLGLLWGEKRKPALGQLNHETYWGRYFYRGLLKEELSKTVFASFLTNPNRSQREDNLKRWSQEKPIAFMQEVLGYRPKTEEERKTLVWSIFAWNGIPDVSMTFHFVEINRIIEEITPTDNWKETEFREILKLEDILSSTFDYMLRWLSSNWPPSDILSKETQRKVQGEIFEKICTTRKEYPEVYANYWLKVRQAEPYYEKKMPWADDHMRKLIIEIGIDKFSKHILSRSQVEGGFLYWLHDLPWENLTALAKDVREHSQDEGENSFLRFVEHALKEERELASNDALEFKTKWRVKLILSPEQWEPKEELDFPLKMDDAYGYNYLFISYPSEKK